MLQVNAFGAIVLIQLYKHQTVIQDMLDLQYHDNVV